MDIVDGRGFSSAQPLEQPAPAQGTVSLAPGGVPVQPAAFAPPTAGTIHHIGFVIEIAGSGSQISLDAARLHELMPHSDPSIAMAGQVGSQVKIRIGNTWLLAASARKNFIHAKAA